jgi:hypothetical protein
VKPLELHWFLVLGIYGCVNNFGGDPGIIPNNCSFHDQRVQMPSLEICRVVRDLNGNSKCIAEAIDVPTATQQGTTTK